MHVVSTRRAWYEVLLCGVLLPLALVLCGVAFRLYARTAYPTDYEEQVSAAAAACDLPPSLIYAVIRTESGFRPDVVSAADARGLMQITEKTFAWAQQRSPEAEELSPDRLYDPAVNIRYGSYILALL